MLYPIRRPGSVDDIVISYYVPRCMPAPVAIALKFNISPTHAVISRERNVMLACVDLQTGWTSSTSCNLDVNLSSPFAHAFPSRSRDLLFPPDLCLDKTSSCLTTNRCAKHLLAKPYALFASALGGRSPCSPSSPTISYTPCTLYYTILYHSLYSHSPLVDRPANLQ